MLDLLVDGGLLVVGAHGEAGDLSHQGVVSDTANNGGTGPLGAAGAKESQVLRYRTSPRRFCVGGGEGGMKSWG